MYKNIYCCLTSFYFYFFFLFFQCFFFSMSVAMSSNTLQYMKTIQVQIKVFNKKAENF